MPACANGKNGMDFSEQPLFTHTQEPVFIGHITDRKCLAENDTLLKSWVTTYRDIFGHGKPVDKTSWGEYLRCQDCGTTRSIEAVYGCQQYNYLGALEKDQSAKGENCPDCGAVLDLFYDTEDLMSETRTRLRENKFFGSLLMGQREEIRGFIYAWVTTIENIWREKLAGYYEQSRLTFPDFLRQIADNTQGKLKADTLVFWLAECGQTLPSRHPEIFFGLLKRLFQSLPEEVLQLPTLVSSMPKVRSYLFLRAAGATSITRTNDWPLEVLTAPTQLLQTEYSRSAADFQSRHRSRFRDLLRQTAN